MANRHGAISSRNTSKLVGCLLMLSGAPFALGQQQPRPVVTECETNGSSAHYQEALTGTGSSMGRNTTTNTGCPNHVNWAMNPNSAVYTASDVTAPAYPMLMSESKGVTDLSEKGGAVGIMFNGVALFSGWAGTDPAVSYQTSAAVIEGDTFDPCGGHSTADGIYHYHNTAGCLQEQAMLNAETTSSDHSPQLGWSHDGFPVYGQLGPDGVEMLMCGQTGADETYCLDSCNGYEGTLDGVDDFKYRYYGSCGFDEAFFPFTTNCYRGCCPDGVTCGQYVEACGSSAVEGYTVNYTPDVVERGLDEAYDSMLIEGDDTDLIGSERSLDCSTFMGSFESDAAPGPGNRRNNSTSPAPSSSMEASTQPPGTPAPSPLPEDSTQPPGGGRGRNASTPAPSVTAAEEGAFTNGPALSPTSAAEGSGGDSPSPAPSITTEEPSTNEPTRFPTPESGSEAPDSRTEAPTAMVEGSSPANDEGSGGAGIYRHATTASAAGLALTVLTAAATITPFAEFLV